MLELNLLQELLHLLQELSIELCTNSLLYAKQLVFEFK